MHPRKYSNYTVAQAHQNILFRLDSINDVADEPLSINGDYSILLHLFGFNPVCFFFPKYQSKDKIFIFSSQFGKIRNQIDFILKVEISSFIYD